MRAWLGEGGRGEGWGGVFPMIAEIADFGQKPWTIVRHFDQISFRPHNSSLEGAAELKFIPFCSS